MAVVGAVPIVRGGVSWNGAIVGETDARAELACVSVSVESVV